MTDPTLYAPRPPQPKKGMPVWGWILIAVGACVALCCAGVVAFSLFVSKAATAGDGDATIASCIPDASTGWAHAGVVIRNSDSRPHDYFVTVAFERSGTQLGTGTVVVNDLAAGQTAVNDAVALGKQGSGYTCRITKVTRA